MAEIIKIYKTSEAQRRASNNYRAKHPEEVILYNRQNFKKWHDQIKNNKEYIDKRKEKNKIRYQKRKEYNLMESKILIELEQLIKANE